MIDIHEYDERLESARRRLAKFGNASFLLAFVDHLGALGLSTGRIAKHANHLCTLMGKVPFNTLRADRKDIAPMRRLHYSFLPPSQSRKPIHPFIEGGHGGRAFPIISVKP